MSADNIWILASDGDSEAVKALITSGTPVNSQDENGYSVLAAAISWGHFDLTRWLVQTAGADINIRDTDGETPLFVVESLDAAKLLVELGANVKATNHDGLTVSQLSLKFLICNLFFRFYTSQNT